MNVLEYHGTKCDFYVVIQMKYGLTWIIVEYTFVIVLLLMLDQVKVVEMKGKFDNKH